MTRLSAAEARPDVVARMNHLSRASPKTGKRMSTSKISAAPAEPGHHNGRRCLSNLQALVMPGGLLEIGLHAPRQRGTIGDELQRNRIQAVALSARLGHAGDDLIDGPHWTFGIASDLQRQDPPKQRAEGARNVRLSHSRVALRL